jgi:hypothetical protein
MMRAMGKLDGRCLCGAVSYTSDAEPVGAAVCHCRNCQRHSGTAFSFVVLVPAQSLAVTGDALASFAQAGDEHDEPTTRWFCTGCGSPLWSESPLAPGMRLIRAGTLDDPSWLEPQYEVYTESRLPWLAPSGVEHQFPRGPRSAGVAPG